LAFEIGAGHIAEQHLVLDGEQLAAALRQMRFQRGLVGEEMIKPAIEPIYRIVSANERDGNYIVTAFLQTSEPTGANTISNNVYVIQPTLAFGMGFGDFDFQGTVSQQYAVATVGPPATLTAFGNPFLGNLALQYHYGQYFWPEFEFNYTYWPFGTHANLSQLLLTPGIIFGRFNLGGRVNAIFGVGYQFAVTDAPVTRNNWAVTTRITF
jgi:hypothetical protein